MNRMSGWTLFTFRGVAVNLHASLLFLIFYVVLAAAVQFPYVIESSDVDPARISGSALLWAIIFALTLLVSIFLHEFGHVLVAQAYGYKTRQITLMMLGGVSQMEKIPETPAIELKVAAIGPLVSISLAFFLFAIRAATNSANIALFCFWVGQTNLILGIFNLLPAFPTDGGRILRSILVTRQGRLRGTQNAVRVSRVFAWIFGILGLLQLNLFLILIAFFIWSAARSELFVLVGQVMLKGMKARDLMLEIPAVPGNAMVGDVAAMMARCQQLLLPVTGAESCNAIVTADFLRQVPRRLWNSTPISAVKFEFEKSARADDALEDILPQVLSTPAGAVPVCSENTVMGVVRAEDLIETMKIRQLAIDSHQGGGWSLGLGPGRENFQS